MDTFQPMLAVFLVLALLGGALFLLRKRDGGPFPLGRFANGGLRRMEPIERLALGPQHALHLIRIDGRALIVATAPGSCQLLCGAERPESNA